MNLSSQLTQLEVVDLIRRLAEAEPAFAFKHPLTQASAYDSLLHRDRQALHHQVATVYEDMYPARLDDLAALLAHHYAEAHDDAKTLEFATRAGDVASRVYANAEAIAFYAQALDAAKRIGAPSARLVYLYTKRGRVLEVIGRNPEALATYEEMFEYAREHGDVALEMESLLLQGILHSISDSDREQALSLAKRGETLACELGDRKAQARALWIEQLTYTYTYAPEKAIASGEQALAIAREVDAPELVGYILGDLCRVYQNLNLEKARTLSNDARMIWRSLDNKPMLADSLGASAWLAYTDGDFDKSLSYSREGLEISKTVGSKLGQMFNESVQLSTSLDLGDVAGALENAEASLVEAENMARDLNRPMLRLAQLALALGILGSYDRAQDLARRAREILEQPMQSFFKVMGWGILAQYYVTIGDLDAAQTAFGNSQTNDVWLGAVTMSEYLLARGDYVEAARLSEQEVAHRRHLGYIQPLPGLLYVQARSVRALGKPEQALELLTQARVAAEKISHRRLLWQIYSLLSEMERERGNIPEAAQFQAKAREVIGFIVDHTPPELRDAFLAQPAVHAIMDEQ